ncbi:MAG TPA: Rne/Rng family ribonuclease [Natronosporangium sp.]
MTPSAPEGSATGPPAAEPSTGRAGRRRTRRASAPEPAAEAPPADAGGAAGGEGAAGDGTAAAADDAAAAGGGDAAVAGDAAAAGGEAAAEGDAAAPEEAGAEAATGRSGRSRRRGRRGRGRGKGAAAAAAAEAAQPADQADADAAETAAASETSSEPPPAAEGEPEAETTTTVVEDGTVRRRRRRRRRRSTAEAEPTTAEEAETTTERSLEDEVRGVAGSTRLEAKRQRRRGGRDQRRTRPPVLSESEFLSRRESVDRVMVIREKAGRTQIAVLEDGILVEHYVSRTGSHSMAGSVFLGKVQNVLPSMEAAFVDVGRGRNAVLYAGEVNWEAAGLEGKARSIEQALKPGDSVLVQVTKDPVGHKGARLTSHIALSGRHLVYVPNGTSSGISRKLPDSERRRLRAVLKDLVPEGAGVIVRTAAEGASAEDLARDIKRLQAQWEDIQAKAAKGNAPALLYSEPDLVVRVVRDLFNEDFRELVIEGDSAYDTVEAYLAHVSPDLLGRLRRHTGPGDVFAEHRIDEQILKGLDRKVYLPSGGHLVFDRTEAMTVIDVNTGKYTGTGGNLEETVTRNNLEAAEEIVRQLRLRDIGGIIVIDFIDMVLESNRELVLRRLTECLGRDRTKHQVTEITSLGLVQMTRKRVGAGLLEAFSEPCEHCNGRGVIINLNPPGADRPRSRDAAEKVKAVASASAASERRRGRSGGRGEAARGRGGAGAADAAGEPEAAEEPAPAAATLATATLAVNHATGGDSSPDVWPDGTEPATTGAGGSKAAAVPGGASPDGRRTGSGALREATAGAAPAGRAAPTETDRADGVARLDEADRQMSATGEAPIIGKVLRRFLLGTNRRRSRT